jgi:hypothetical protein
MVFAVVPEEVESKAGDVYNTILSLYHLIENVDSVVPLTTNPVQTILNTTHHWRLPSTSPLKTMRSMV